MTLLKIEDVPRDATVIREQIELRRKLAGDMVGWLYPSILADEIAQLNRMLELGKKTLDL